MKRLAVLLLVGMSLPLVGQGLAPLPDAKTSMSPYAAGREAMMASALAALNRKEYASALGQFEAVLTQYPKDARVLMFAARTAHLTGDDKKAADYYKTALRSEPQGHPLWALHVEAVPIYAAAGDWGTFDRERAQIRAAVLANAPFFANFTDYLVESLHDGEKTIQVTEYPRLNGRFHTRYRFVFPVDSAAAGWRPYIDCESDDIDQVSFAKSHPVEASKGERAFSLDSYLRANTHGTMMLFGDGEPTYETVRALVMKNAVPLAATTRQ